MDEDVGAQWAQGAESRESERKVGACQANKRSSGSAVGKSKAGEVGQAQASQFCLMVEAH